MYPYHNQIKKRIKEGKLLEIIWLDKEDFLFAFIFIDKPTYRPIRYRSAYRYMDVLEKNKNLIKKKTDWFSIGLNSKLKYIIKL